MQECIQFGGALNWFPVLYQVSAAPTRPAKMLFKYISEKSQIVIENIFLLSSIHNKLKD